MTAPFPFPPKLKALCLPVNLQEIKAFRRGFSIDYVLFHVDLIFSVCKTYSDYVNFAYLGKTLFSV